MAEKNKEMIAVENGNLGEMQNVTNIANAITTIIDDKKLSMAIYNKRYVFVEGWQLAGAYFGIVPIVKKLELIPTNDAKEIKYRAEVELMNVKTDKIVGFGIAVCSNKEVGKTAFAEYAVASMAQTRAVGKAYRLVLGWIVKMAGYEGTPAEEMEEGDEDKQPDKTMASDEDKAKAFAEARAKVGGF